ncbi:MAG: hypothetical protein ACF8CQ_05360 [Rhodopirellula sp. JB044]|uniref:hypothetical protein n=1 Tax=Rhodopirellula sp. JB044 TaxID=3342844 RepID=UPI00370BF058
MNRQSDHVASVGGDETSYYRTTSYQRVRGEPLQFAIGLLSQQVWCWGQDILRPEGNWLLEIGFERLRPPTDRKNCSSVYVLELPHGRRVVLRGFGVFYGDETRGGVFLRRFEFQPKYTEQPKLDCPPWSDEDLPSLSPPNDSQRNVCASLTLDLIDWIRAYEVNIVEQLGIEYRRQTLAKWNNGERPFTPAEKFASAWRGLSFQIAANFDSYLGHAKS